MSANNSGDSSNNKRLGQAQPGSGLAAGAGQNELLAGQQPSQQGTQYSQADLNKIVLEYLNKKGYHRTESMLRNESSSVAIGYNQPLPVSPASTGIPGTQPPLIKQLSMHTMGYNGSSSFKFLNATNPTSDILNDISAQAKNPEHYFKGYRLLRDWINSSLDIYRPELSKLLYPIFVNCYIDLVLRNQTETAKEFFEKFKDDHLISHGSDIVELSAIGLVDHLKTDSFIKNFRKGKYKIRISSISLHLLLYFLDENKYVGGELIIRLINQYLDFDIKNSEDKSTEFESSVANIQLLNSAKLTLGKYPRDENFDKEIEGELRLKDEKEQQKKKPGAKKLSLVDEFQKMKSENGNPTVSASSRTVAEKQAVKEGEEDNENEEGDEIDDKIVVEEEEEDSAGSLLAKLKRNDENFDAPNKEALPLPAKSMFDLKKEIQLVQDSRARLRLSFDKNQFSPPSVCMYTFHNSLDEITCLEFNENSNMIAAGFEDSYIKLWSIDGNPLKSIVKNDPQNNSSTRRLIGHSGTVYGLSFSQENNYLLSCSEDGTVRLWSLDTFTTLVIYKSHNEPVWDVKFSPFGHYFVTTSHDSTARLWSVDHIYPLRLFVGHMNDVDCVCWFPNSCYCFTGSSDKSIRMWDVVKGESVRLFIGHNSAINALAVSPEGRLLASAGEDSVINIWDISSGKILKSMRGHSMKASIYSLDFSKDGNVLVSGGSDGAVRIWDVKKNSENKLSEPESFFSNSKEGENGNADSANGKLSEKDKDESHKGKDVNSSTNDLVASFFTKQTNVYKVHFTRRNLCLAAGAFQP